MRIMKPIFFPVIALALFLTSCSQDTSLEDQQTSEIEKITELTHQGVRAYKDMVAASMYTVLNYPSLNGRGEGTDQERTASPQFCIAVEPDPSLIEEIPEEGLDLVVDFTGECSSLSSFEGTIDMTISGEKCLLSGSEMILRPRKGATSGDITFSGRGGVKLVYLDSTDVRALLQAQNMDNDPTIMATIESIDFSETLFYQTEILGELGFEDDFPAGQVNLRVADMVGGLTTLTKVFNNDREDFSTFLDDQAAVSFENMSILIRDLDPFKMNLLDSAVPLTFSLACGCPVNGGIEVPEQFFIDYSMNVTCDSIRASGDLLLPCD